MRAARRGGTTSELNLLPIMNLISILIPFLLMTAQFVHLAIIDTTLPTLGTGDPDDAPEASLTLAVRVDERGLTVLGADPVLYPDGAPPEPELVRAPTLPCAAGLCRAVGDYNWSGLTALLARIKDLYPNEENIILLPDSRTPYEVIVAAMDAARADGSTRGADGKPRALFPKVVLADGAL